MPEFEIPSTMKAQRLTVATGEMTVEEIPVPSPAADEVLLKVAYCGICASDLSLMKGHLKSSQDVITQGHELSGVVVAVGEDVTQWSVGDRLVPSAGKPCGVCRNCRSGDPANCTNVRILSFAYDGGWAQYVVVPAIGCTPIPADVPMEQAALLADAVATPFGAVTGTAQVRAGESAGVWGVGGIGTHLVQLLHLAGAAPIIAVDLDDAVLERAASVGADYTFRSDDPELQEKILEATGGWGLDVGFDAVGLTVVTKAVVAALGLNGRAVTVGMGDQTVEAGNFRELALGHKQVRGHLGYGKHDAAVLARLLAHGRLDLSHSISRIIALEDIAEGVEMLDKKIGNPIRILVQPNGDPADWPELG